MAQILEINKLTWNPQDSYEKINNEINKWPNWKKKAYNDMFAISKHAKKIPIDLDVNYGYSNKINE